MFCLLTMETLLKYAFLFVFLSLEKWQICYDIIYHDNPLLLPLLTIVGSHISIKMLSLHLYPLQSWLQDHITTINNVMLFYSLNSIKWWSIKKSHYYAWPPNDYYYTELFLITSTLNVCLQKIIIITNIQICRSFSKISQKSYVYKEYIVTEI